VKKVTYAVSFPQIVISLEETMSNEDKTTIEERRKYLRTMKKRYTEANRKVKVQLLARLGGWTPHEDRKPGKTALTRGLRRMLDMLVTRSYLDRYVVEHGGLPPHIAALLTQPAPAEL
jgi:phosphopantetheine adenylyltransferase